MPDPTRKSISASQMPALFNCSPYLSRWMLWHDFRGTAKLPFDDLNERMEWGNALQDPILRRTAHDYRARMLSNTEKRLYVRRGRVGHTRDGRMIGTGRGRINVEAKNVDSLVWKQEWGEVSAPQHIEIQAEVGSYVDRCDLTVIAVLIGGNAIRYYERTPRRDFHERMIAEALGFFASLRTGPEPDPAGLPIELPMLASVYPETDEEKILERLEDPELRDLLKQWAFYMDQRVFAQRVLRELKPKILAIARDCSIVRANQIEARIQKTHRLAEEVVDNEVLFGAQAIQAWARLHFGEDMTKWPRELVKLAGVLKKPWAVYRDASVSQRIYTQVRHWDAPLPGDDILSRFNQDEIGA